MKIGVQTTVKDKEKLARETLELAGCDISKITHHEDETLSGIKVTVYEAPLRAL